ncbi:MAG: hypothetical protein JXQ73_28595 [Phycisphaerae bacterium]|nr:hypothetical protein [Phycisphaerae bacterium]
MAPIKKFSAGTISCALWENEAKVDGRKLRIMKATIDRRYRDKDGTWKSTGSFGRSELPLVIFCLMQAFSGMVGEGAEGSGDSPSVEEETVR